MKKNLRKNIKKIGFIDKYLLSPSEKALDEKSFFEVFLKNGLDFFSGKLRKNKVVVYKSSSDLKKILSQQIPKQPIKKSELIKLIKIIGNFSICQADKKYLGFPDTGNSKYAIGGAIYSQFLNQNQIAFDRSSPVGTIIEIQLIEWLREMIGYKTLPLEEIDMLLRVGGMWTPGGNLSNYISILTALNNRFPSIKERGIASLDKKPVLIMTGGIEHYSYKSACSWLGLGEDSIVWAEPGRNYTSNSYNFEKAIRKIKKDKIPFYAVAVAGNCRTSGLDNIEEIAKVCKKHNLWLHADACHGGSLLFSKKYKKLLKGIERADSVSLDPHKSLFIPYSSSYILFKNPEVMSLYSRYPGKANQKDYIDLGLTTPFLGSRGFESLKFWLFIKGTGLNAIEKLIERRHYLARFWYNLISNSKNVVVLNDIDFYRIAFVIFPKDRLRDLKKINTKEKIEYMVSKYTKIVSDMIYKDGNVCMDEFKLKDFNRKLSDYYDAEFLVMGTTIGNASTDEKNLIESERILSQAISKIINKYLTELDNLIKNKTINSMRKIKNSSPSSWN